jgi:hypothetical protein
MGVGSLSREDDNIECELPPVLMGVWTSEGHSKYSGGNCETQFVRGIKRAPDLRKRQAPRAPWPNACHEKRIGPDDAKR